MDKRKRGIALFITLMVVASIMSIVAVSFSYLDKAQKDAGQTSAIIQGNLLYKNTVDILKLFFPAGSNNSDKLEMLYSMPLPITEPKSGLSLTISCQPLMRGVPISWLDESLTQKVPQKTTLAKKVLQTVMEEYEVEDPNLLEKLIIQAVSAKYLDNEEYKPRVRAKKGIVSKEQLNRVAIDYLFLADDTKVLTIPWEKYFTFTTVDNRTKIDGVYLSAELISVAFDIPIEIVQDSWNPQEMTLIEFLKENGITEPINKKIYSNKALNAMHCEVTYTYKKNQYGFNFNYIEGRSGNFEFKRE